MEPVISFRARPALFAREPYRLFFPLALAAGVAGVLLWPLFYAGKLPFYPNLAHARVMVEGLFGGFVLGFLGTAFPRVVGAKPLRWPEVAALLALWVTTALCQLSNHLRAGDGAFAAAVALWFVVMVPRFGQREDVPPPGFPLALLGVGGGAVAAAVLACNAPGALPPFWHRFLHLLLYQGFPLLPILGIGPFLIPRFFGQKSDHTFPESRHLPAGWGTKAAWAGATGAVIWLSFALEALDLPRTAHGLRAAAVVAALGLTTPVFRKSLAKASLATALRIATVSIAAGYLANTIHPVARLGNLHLTFVSGLALFTLAVGTRVILGHGGRHDLLGGKLVFIRWVAGLALLASTTRMSADYLPKILISHHKYAAWTWATVSVIWLAALAKYLFRTDENPSSLPKPLPPVPEARRCPKPARPGT